MVIDGQDGKAQPASDKKKWIKPRLHVLRAGQAELLVGTEPDGFDEVS